VSEPAPLVTPFRGEHYAALTRLSDLVAPPYDVISAEARAQYAARDPHNIVHVMLPEAAGDRYAHAADLLGRWRKEGVYRPADEPSCWVLAQEFALPGGERRTRLGFFAAVHAESFSKRRVRPHEKTHAGPKADRLALLQATRTNVESIFLLAPDQDGTLAAMVAEVTKGRPVAEAELEGVKLRLWVVAGAAASRITDHASRGPLYIADGHHRYETAVAYAKEHPEADRVLSFIVSARDAGLVVLPTHRVIYGSEPSAEQLLGQWRPWFTVHRTEHGGEVAQLRRLGAGGTACLVAWPKGGDMILTWKPDAPPLPDHKPGDLLAGLDVTRVETLVVRPLLGAGRSTPTLIYTADAAEALAMVRTGNAAAAVLLNATKVDQVVAVADAGGFMPPKSTYFAPKVPSGLVIRRTDGTTD
jgi:uncharacterized protein (DUF1015 family)